MHRPTSAAPAGVQVKDAYFNALQFAGIFNIAIERLAGANFPFVPLRFLYPVSVERAVLGPTVACPFMLPLQPPDAARNAAPQTISLGNRLLAVTVSFVTAQLSTDKGTYPLLPCAEL